jgi:hypothetical protein
VLLEDENGNTGRRMPHGDTETFRHLGGNSQVQSETESAASFQSNLKLKTQGRSLIGRLKKQHGLLTP